MRRATVRENAMIFLRIPLIGTAMIAAIAVSSSADAQSVADFYQGKRIELIVGSGSGGGYDTYARMMARYMPRHIPGHPDIIVKNMDGAGSIIAANYVYNVAAQDGTVIGALQRNAPIVQIMGQDGPQFEALKFQWIGSFNNEVGIIAVAKRTGVTKFEDLFEKQVTFGSTGPNDTEFYPALLNNTIGTQIKLIKGYPSTPPVHLAIERGEVSGISQSWASFQEQSNLYKRGEMALLAQVSLKPLPELAKMNVPLITEFIEKGKLQSGYTVEGVNTIYRLLLATKIMGRPYAMGPGVPADRVDAIRNAFDKTAQDERFLADARKQGREVSLVTGREIQEIVSKMAAAPKDLLANIEEVTKFRGLSETAKVDLTKRSGPVVSTANENREITIRHGGKDVSATVSGSRTKVVVDGKEAKRGAIKAGMNCTISYSAPGGEATEITCNSGQVGQR